MHKNDKILTAKILLFVVFVLGIFTKTSDAGIFGEEKLFEFYEKIGNENFLIGLSKFMSFIGSVKFILPLVLCIVFYSFKNNRRDLFIGVLSASLFSNILNLIIKLVFRRKRPADMLVFEGTFSYPSGHAMTNTSLYLFFAYYLSRYVDKKHKKIYFLSAFVIIFLIAWSRTYLKVHFLTDVIGGVMGGVSHYLLTIDFIEKLRIREYHR